VVNVWVGGVVERRVDGGWSHTMEVCVGCFTRLIGACGGNLDLCCF
jgi:hypothetical protein